MPWPHEIAATSLTCVFEVCKSTKTSPTLLDVAPSIQDEATLEIVAKLCDEHRMAIVFAERMPGTVIRISPEGWIWVDSLLWVIFG